MLNEMLIRLFVRDYRNPERPDVRLSYGLLSGYTGVLVNILLFGIKFSIGLLSGSIAIAADAVNNISDAGSSVITIFGFKLSSKPADKEHPFGHGRMEYVAALIVSVIIVAVGFNFLKESVVRIFSPQAIHTNALVLGIFGGTMLFKLWLFFFYRRIGKRINSSVLRAAAFDSLSDLLATTVVLIAVIAARFTEFPIDGCAGTVVAGLVILGGIEILRDAINPLVGECPDPHLVEELQERLLKCPGIRGIHDIILHNYGPNQYFATAHAEVNREGDLLSVHDTLEAAEVEIAKSMPIRLILHCDPYDTEDPHIKNWRAKAENAISSMDHKFKLYDFRMEEPPEGRSIHFHLLVPRNYSLSYDQISEELTRKMAQYDPNITLHIEFINAFV